MKHLLSMKGWITLGIGLWLSLLSVQAQVDVEDLPPISGTYALTNVTVHVKPGQVLSGATVVIKDGLITAVGSNVAVPGEAITLEADSMHVYAGFIDGLSQAGQEKPERNRRERPDDPGNPPMEIAGIQPQRQVMDLIDESSSDFGKLRATGFTTAHLVPMGGMFPGQGAIVTLTGKNADDMRLAQPTSMFIQFEGASGRAYPSNLLGVTATFKQMYRQAELAVAHEAQYQSNPSGMTRPSYSQEVRALYPMVQGELPTMALAEDRKDVYRFLKLGEELGFSPVLAGVQEASYQVEAIKAAGVPVFLSLDLPEKPEEAEVDSSLSEAMQAEAAALEKRRMEAYEMAIMQASKLHAAGVPFGFTTYDASEKDIPENLKRLVSEGALDEEAALEALTTRPAQIFGLSNMMGTVEAGKMANLIVSDEPFFTEDAKIRFVIVDGSVYEQEAKHKRKGDNSGNSGEAANVAGNWDYTIDSPQGKMTGTLVMKGEGGDYEGTMSSDMSPGETEISDISVDGNNLSFTYSIDAGGSSMEIEISVEIDEDTFEGTVSVAQYGSFPIEGERTGKPE